MPAEVATHDMVFSPTTPTTRLNIDRLLNKLTSDTPDLTQGIDIEALQPSVPPVRQRSGSLCLDNHKPSFTHMRSASVCYNNETTTSGDMLALLSLPLPQQKTETEPVETTTSEPIPVTTELPTTFSEEPPQGFYSIYDSPAPDFAFPEPPHPFPEPPQRPRSESISFYPSQFPMDEYYPSPESDYNALASTPLLDRFNHHRSMSLPNIMSPFQDQSYSEYPPMHSSPFMDMPPGSNPYLPPVRNKRGRPRKTEVLGGSPLAGDSMKSKKPKVKRTESGYYPCPHPGCGKVFERAQNLRSHTRCHLTDAPHSCPECSLKFRRLTDLQRHVRTIHTPNEQKPWGCSGCGRRFGRSDALKRHLSSKSKSNGCPAVGMQHDMKMKPDFLPPANEFLGMIPEVQFM